MKKNIIKVSPYEIVAGLAYGVSPLNWLATYYSQEDLYGKLVVLDDLLFENILNHSNYDECVLETNDDEHTTKFYITWKETKDYPETKITLVSQGAGIEYLDEEGKVRADKANTNWHYIESIQSKDILVDGMKYAENANKDKQFIYLTQKQNAPYMQKEKFKEDLDEEMGR